MKTWYFIVLYVVPKEVTDACYEEYTGNSNTSFTYCS